MSIQKQSFDYFEHKGMDAEKSEATLEDGFYDLLKNVEISFNKTLKKRPGYQGFGDVLSTTAVKHFDRYLTEDDEILIASVDNKLYHSDTTSMPSTTINLRATLSSASDYDSSNGTINLNFSAAHPFVVDDDITVTVGATEYNLTVTVDVDSDTVTVAGVYEDFSSGVIGTEVCYGGRVTDEITVSDATDFAEDDMVTIGSYERHFRVTATDTVSTPNSITIDEEIPYADTSSPDSVDVSERWTQFTTSAGNIQDDTPLDAAATQPYASSSMLRKSLLISDGENEPLKFDGTAIHRLGFHELPDVIDSIQAQPAISGNVSGGTRKYKLTYSLYDNNSELVESGTTYERTVISKVVECDCTTYTLTLDDTDADGNAITTSGLFPGMPVTSSSISSSDNCFIISVDSNTQVTLSNSYTFSNEDVTFGEQDRNLLIPVFSIPYDVSNNLLYDIDRSVVTLYKTEEDGTDYYRAVEVPMNTLGAFHVTNIDDTGLGILADTHSSTTIDGISYLQIDNFSIGQRLSGTDIDDYTYVTDVDYSGYSITVNKAATGTTNNTYVYIRYLDITVAGSPDLSNIQEGDYLLVKGCKDTDNNTVGRIESVNNSTKVIRISAIGTDDITGTPDSRGICAVCMRDNVSDASLVSNDLLYNNKDVEDDNDTPPLAKYVTTWDNRAWFANGKSYQNIFVNMDLDSASDIEDGDTFFITDGTTTEQYEFQDLGDAASSGYIRVPRPTSGFSSHYDLIQAICETINAKADGLCWAYYERVSGAGTFILKERQRTTDTLQFKFNLGTAATMSKIKIGDLWLTSSDNDTYKDFTQDNYGSRIWFSKDGQPASFVGTFSNYSTDSVFYEDVQPDNGQEITGMMPMSSFMLVFKEDSLFRITKSGTDSYSWEIVDGEVGCIAPKSIISIGNRVLFLSRFGVYETDGFFTKFVGKRMKREWQRINTTYQHLACASHLVEKNQYLVCAAYDDVDASEDTTGNNAAFVYDYINDAWFIYSNLEATTFTKIGSTVYFSTVDGKVYTFRRFGESSDYRDDSTAIEATVVTKWFNLNDNSSRKLFQYLVTHLYQSGVDSSIEVSYAYDFNESYEELETVSSYISPWGSFAWGEAPWGFSALEPKKQPLRPQKALYARFKFYNNTLDEVLEIQGITLEAKLLNSQVMPQVDSRSTG